MNVIYVLIPIAIIIVAIALLVFFWAVKANQFDDLERQGSAILFDDDVADIVLDDCYRQTQSISITDQANVAQILSLIHI